MHVAVRNRHHAIASHLLAAGALPNLSMLNLRQVTLQTDLYCSYKYVEITGYNFDVAPK